MDVKALVAKMTLEEKAGLCSGQDFWHTKAVERLQIPAMMVSDGPHGLRKQDESGDHLGINDSIKAVCFPAGCATASSFDRELLYKVGETLGNECQAEGVGVILGPAVNIKRSPLCGRNFEYFSEDPYLTSEIAASQIKGVQSRQVGTSIKHFLANNQEHRRMSSSSEVDERTLREIYLNAFEGAVMSLGVAALGGASAPNYGLATIIGTFIAVRTGTGTDAALAVGLPVGLLAIQLEVVVRIINNFVAHRMQTHNNEGEWGKMNREAWLGPIICSLQTMIPTVIVVCFGADVVNFILEFIPKWVTNGLSIAAGMLPVVGIGMLMRYMPVKKFLPFILVGFVLSAYLQVPVLGIAIIGFAAAFWYFTTEIRKAEAPAAVAVAANIATEEMGDDFDE